MKRIAIAPTEMQTLWRPYCLTDEELAGDSRFAESMAANIDLVVEVLKARGYRVGFQDDDDVFVNHDFSGARVILTELTADHKRTEIENALFEVCGNLNGDCCICLDVQNHEIRKGQRSLISRTAIYQCTEG